MATHTLLQINVTCNWGSTGYIAEEIGKLALQEGWRSIIAFGRNVNESQSEAIRIGNSWSVIWHGLITRIFDRHGFSSTYATKQFIKKIDKIKPNLVHLHNIHGYYINIELLFDYLKRNNIPVVWTLHDCWLMTGHCAYFDYIGCDKWKDGCFDCPQKKNYPASILLDRSKRNYADKKRLFTSLSSLAIVPASKWLGRLVDESFLKKWPHQVIYNGVDLDNFCPRKSSLRSEYNLQDKFIILGVASIWDKRKGLNDFIKLSKIIDNDVQIVLIGVSDKDIKRLPSSIIGIKRTNSIEELAMWYSAADLFVNPTYEDNFPTTNLEALACGTPVVTYKTGGSVEAIDDSTGFIIKQGDIIGINDIISNVKGKGKFFYQETCVARAKSYYNKTERYKEYIELYNEILK